MNMQSWMSELQPAPTSPFDSRGELLVGLYQGSLDAPEWFTEASSAREKTKLLLNTKRWIYFVIENGDWIFSGAIVHVGYASNCFITLMNRKDNSTVFDQSWLGLPEINAHVSAQFLPNIEARFKHPQVELNLRQGAKSGTIQLSLLTPGLHADLQIETQSALTSPIMAIASTGTRKASYTQKWPLLKTTGFFEIDSQRVEILDAQSGIDVTWCQPYYLTEWNWAFLQGVCQKTQTPLAINLTAGNHTAGQTENVLWFGKKIYEISPIRFEFDRTELMHPWKVESPDHSLCLTFSPSVVHHENRNLVLLKSNFTQILGHYSGTVKLPDGQAVELLNAPGVIEDQKVRW
jgi:hypothetical protein